MHRMSLSKEIYHISGLSADGIIMTGNESKYVPDLCKTALVWRATGVVLWKIWQRSYVLCINYFVRVLKCPYEAPEHFKARVELQHHLCMASVLAVINIGKEAPPLTSIPTHATQVWQPCYPTKETWVRNTYLLKPALNHQKKCTGRVQNTRNCF